MALAKRSAAYNNGLDKKTDLPISTHTSNSAWQPSARMRPLSLLRKKRFLLTILGVCLVYLFIRYLPDDVPSVGQRIDSRTGRAQGYPLERDRNSKAFGSAHDGEQEIYDGPVKFYNLAPTLRPHLQRFAVPANNVIFLLRDLRVTSSFIPLACEMAIYNRSSVHVAVISPQDNSIEEIVAVSGIRQTECPVFWHDARPNYNTQSSATRQANVLNAALSHLDAALRPSVVIIDQQQVEDHLFRDAVRSKLDYLRVPFTIVPNDAVRSMSWIASLTGRTIALLNQIRIDIAITPYKQSAGSLMRLLRSIENANYAGLHRPRIMVELPQHVDQFALQYLEHFQWPYDAEAGQNKLILRRGIDASQLSPTLAVVRSLELFYPASWSLSHILVLEPDVEVSPDYLQYLLYMMLEYRYGVSGLNMSDSMMGISLSLPERGLDDQTAFITPINFQFNSLFWSQSPSSTATLYFGDKWTELQNWLTERLRRDPGLERQVSESSTTVSAKHPAWLKYAQELMHARNYHILYPGFAKSSDSKLITIHDEAHQDPEDFTKDTDQLSRERSKGALDISKDDVLGAVQASKNTHNVNAVGSSISLPALILGKKEAQKRLGLPQDVELLMYSSNGRRTDPTKSQAYAKTFGDRVSIEVGGCKTLEERDERLQDRLEYLFCDKTL